MSKGYANHAENETINPPNGGLVHSDGNVFAPALTACTPVDVGFGPVAIGTPTDSVVSVSDLTYATGGESGLPILGLGVVVGAPVAQEMDRSDVPDPPRNPDMTRRGVLALAAGLLVSSGTAAAASGDTVRLGLCKFSVTNATGPISVRVLDIVDEVLPTGTEILVDAAGTRAGEVAKPGEGVTLSKDIRGEVTVYLQGERGLLDSLLAWIRSLVGGKTGVTFSRQLPKSAADYDEGNLVKLSSHPSIVQPVEAGAPDEVRLRIGASTIPHEESDNTGELGSYGIFDGSLVYEVGSNPPDSKEWKLETNLGLLTQTLNDIPL